MSDSKVFAGVRVSKALTVVAAAGCASVLAACTSQQQDYRPTPHYSNTQPANSQPTYTQSGPSATNPPPPAPAPKKPAGGGCGSKCG